MLKGLSRCTLVIYLLTSALSPSLSARGIHYKISINGKTITTVGFSLSQEKRIVRWMKELKSIPKEDLWVNLAPWLMDNQITSPSLSNSTLGKALLEIDLQLKQDARHILSEILEDYDLLSPMPIMIRLFIKPVRASISLGVNFVEINNMMFCLEVDVANEESPLSDKIQRELRSRILKLIHHSPRYSILRQAFAAVLAFEYLPKHQIYNLPRPDRLFPIDKKQFLRQYQEIFLGREEEEIFIGGLSLCIHGHRYNPSTDIDKTTSQNQSPSLPVRKIQKTYPDDPQEIKGSLEKQLIEMLEKIPKIKVETQEEISNNIKTLFEKRVWPYMERTWDYLKLLKNYEAYDKLLHTALVLLSLAALDRREFSLPFYLLRDREKEELEDYKKQVLEPLYAIWSSLSDNDKEAIWWAATLHDIGFAVAEDQRRHPEYGFLLLSRSFKENLNYYIPPLEQIVFAANPKLSPELIKRLIRYHALLADIPCEVVSKEDRDFLKDHIPHLTLISALDSIGRLNGSILSSDRFLRFHQFIHDLQKLLASEKAWKKGVWKIRWVNSLAPVVFSSWEEVRERERLATFPKIIEDKIQTALSSGITNRAWALLLDLWRLCKHQEFGLTTEDWKNLMITLSLATLVDEDFHLSDQPFYQNIFLTPQEYARLPSKADKGETYYPGEERKRYLREIAKELKLLRHCDWAFLLYSGKFLYHLARLGIEFDPSTKALHWDLTSLSHQNKRGEVGKNYLLAFINANDYPNLLCPLSSSPTATLSSDQEVSPQDLSHALEELVQMEEAYRKDPTNRDLFEGIKELESLIQSHFQKVISGPTETYKNLSKPRTTGQTSQRGGLEFNTN